MINATVCEHFGFWILIPAKDRQTGEFRHPRFFFYMNWLVKQFFFHKYHFIYNTGFKNWKVVTIQKIENSVVTHISYDFEVLI